MRSILNLICRPFKQQKLNELTLRFFEDDLEKSFLEYYFQRTIGHVRVALLTGVFLYATFGILDGFIIPESKHWSWLIRYAIVVPFMMFVYFSTFSALFKKHIQSLQVVSILVPGFGIIAMLLLSAAPGKYLYYAGLILVVMFAYTFLRLRFIYATLASWMVVIGYEAAALFWGHLSIPLLLNNSFFLISANLIGMFASYQTERFIRNDFLQRKHIRDLEQNKYSAEKQTILKDLHDGVGGMATNILMLAETAQNQHSDAETKKILTTISELARESLVEIRMFLHSLDAKEMTWKTWTAELRYRGAAMLEPHGISFDLDVSISADENELSSLWALNLLKIYREAITNIIKHANATAVRANLRITNERLLFVIHDNGIGSLNGSRRGRGIANMKMRATEIGGTLAITFTQGMCVKLEIPFAIASIGQSEELARTV